MQKLSTALLALIFSATALTGVALAKHDAGNGGNGRSCVNPAGHERGWCKRNNGSNHGGSNYSTISGTVIAINGDIAQLRQDNGGMVTVSEQNLLRAGSPLQIGAHYTLQGYFSNNLFVAAVNGYNGNGNGNGYPGNGYPGGNATLHGVITAVSGNRVTLLQGLFSTITINDQQALNNGSAQNLYVGRSITANGFWSGNVFYATSIG